VTPCAAICRATANPIPVDAPVIQTRRQGSGSDTYKGLRKPGPE
jgi:hypothetical protein